MRVTVSLPSTLSAGGAASLEIEGVSTIAELVDVLERRVPGLAAGLDDAAFSVAVNDELLLQRARERELRDGDRVEIVPTLAGGGPPDGLNS